MGFPALSFCGVTDRCLDYRISHRHRDLLLFKHLATLLFLLLIAFVLPQQLKMRQTAIVLATIACPVLVENASSFSFVLMAKRGKGNLKRVVEGADSVSKKKSNSANSINQGKGQEITGVTLPAENMIKGWEFGDKVTMACANVNGVFHAVQGDCPRCGFDLWKGDLIADDPAWEELPRVACPTCATTYSMKTGRYGPQLKRTGLAGFVGNLAKTATQGDRPRDAKAFTITQDEDGRVYCRQRAGPQ